MASAPKEAVVIILDVGASTTDSGFQSSIDAVRLLARQKVMFGSKDEIGIVLFGCKETKNELNESEGGYEHVQVLKSIGFPDVSMLKSIQEIERGGDQGDLLDALVVGMDMLMKKQQADPKKKYQKRMFVVTTAGDPISMDGMTDIVETFNKIDAKLNVIGIDFDEPDEEGKVDPSPDKSELKVENEAFIRDLTKRLNGVIVPVTQAIEMMSYFRSKGDLEISPKIKINVWSFLKTKHVTLPTMEKISTVSIESAGVGGESKAIREVTFYSATDIDKEMQVPAEERIKGYKYGKTLVPFAKVDESTMKYEADSCLKVIGFTSSKNVPRYHFISTAEQMIANPEDPVAQKALSAIIHALVETDSVAIVRYVKRARSAPHLAVLSPSIKLGAEFLYLNMLPFSEDLRQYTFSSLAPEKARKAYVPSEEQVKAMDDFIDSMDLMKAASDEQGNKMEALKPKHVYNPVLQQFYQAVEKRALDSTAEIPPLHPVIEKYLNPDPSILETAEPALKKLKAEFPLEKNEKMEAKKRVFWQDNIAENLVQLDSYLPDEESKRKKDGKAITLDEILSKGVTEVGSVRPVEDFKEMLARRDVDLIQLAMEGMKSRIIQQVTDSIMTQLYPKAFDCLLTFREAAIQEEESEYFNKSLREMRTAFEGRRRDDFWKLIVERKISLITSEEAEDSEVSLTEAQQFLAGPVVSQESAGELYGAIWATQKAAGPVGMEQ
ncbi:hypothetical protein PROFUN_12616 [Planoprotostelium fungivorum]|uniref:ATP-dependent DNA helicase II subunit 2 n=1 Tax=Planoprotostelium fungivorum TaxID=1890364 RepID=A0A2P6N730_9EUKA|nr:hypothetical protein PROFUN_12616 [Planoprotostelium fungivorum]